MLLVSDHTQMWKQITSAEDEKSFGLLCHANGKFAKIEKMLLTSLSQYHDCSTKVLKQAVCGS